MKTAIIVVALVAVAAAVYWFVIRPGTMVADNTNLSGPDSYSSGGGTPMDERGALPPTTTEPTSIKTPTVRGTASGNFNPTASNLGLVKASTSFNTAWSLTTMGSQPKAPELNTRGPAPTSVSPPKPTPLPAPKFSNFGTFR